MAVRSGIDLCRCILDIPLSVGADPRHFDPLLAGKGLAGTEWLVQSLQSLIDAGFKMATGQVRLPVILCQTSGTHAASLGLCRAAVSGMFTLCWVECKFVHTAGLVQSL